MKVYAYKAKDQEGKTQSGKVESRDVNTAVSVLRDRGLVVIDIKASVDGGSFSTFTKYFQKVSLNDVVAFTRQLSTMISSGLPLTEALSILELQSKPTFAKVIGDVLRDVQAGNSVGDAMEKHRQVFSDVYVSLVRAGEAAGALDDILQRLAINMEKQKEFRSKTRGALIYPAIVTVGMILVTLIMMIFVVPRLAEMYKDFDAELPLPTQILIGFSDLVNNFWYIFLIAGIGGFFAFRYWKNTPQGTLQYDKLMLKVPVFGKLRSQIILAETSRTLGLLISAGISLIEALEIVDRGIDNQIYRNGIQRAVKNVKKGMPFSVAMTREEMFPPLLPNMIAVGEETGKMDEVLMKVASYFEEEAEQMIKNLTTALEPLIMIVLGIGVGFLVISIIMPIYNLTNQF